MCIQFDSSQHDLHIASRLAEMRAIVDEAHLARRLRDAEHLRATRQPRRFRRQIGGLLMAAGQVLAR